MSAVATTAGSRYCRVPLADGHGVERRGARVVQADDDAGTFVGTRSGESQDFELVPRVELLHGFVEHVHAGFLGERGGGTHVANIAEIGGIRVIHIRYEGKRKKRVEIALTS